MVANASGVNYNSQSSPTNRNNVGQVMSSQYQTPKPVDLNTEPSANMSTQVGPAYADKSGGLVITGPRPASNISTLQGAGYAAPSGQIFLMGPTASEGALSHGSIVRQSLGIAPSAVPTGFSPDLAYTNIDVSTGRPVGVTFYQPGVFGDTKFVSIDKLKAAAAAEGLPTVFIDNRGLMSVQGVRSELTPVKGFSSEAPRKIQPLSIESAPIKLGSNIDMLNTMMGTKTIENKMLYENIQTNQTNSSRIIQQILGNQTNATIQKNPNTFSTLEESSTQALKDALQKEAKGEPGAASEVFLQSLRLARAKGSPIYSNEPGPLRENENPIEHALQGLQEFGKGFAIAAGQGAFALRDIQNQLTKIVSGKQEGLTGLAELGVGTAVALKATTLEAGRGSPYALGQLVAMTPISAAFTKALPRDIHMDLKVQEAVKVMKVEETPGGVTLTGTAEAIAKTGEKTVSTAAQDFSVKVVQANAKLPIVEKGTIEGVSFRAESSLQPYTDIGIGKSIGTVTKVIGKEGAKETIPTSARFVSFGGSSAKALEAANRPKITSAVVALGEGLKAKVLRETPNTIYTKGYSITELPMLSAAIREISPYAELYERGTLITQGRGPLSGSKSIITIGEPKTRMTFASEGITRLETAKPRELQGQLIQSYVGEQKTRLVSGQATASNVGKVSSFSKISGLVVFSSEASKALKEFNEKALGVTKSRGEGVKEASGGFNLEITEKYLKNQEKVSQVISQATEGARTAAIAGALSNAPSPKSITTPKLSFSSLEAIGTGVLQRVKTGEIEFSSFTTGPSANPFKKVQELGNINPELLITPSTGQKFDRGDMNAYINRLKVKTDYEQRFKNELPRIMQPGEIPVIREIEVPKPVNMPGEKNIEIPQPKYQNEELYKFIESESNTLKTVTDVSSKISESFRSMLFPGFTGGGGGADITMPPRPSAYARLIGRRGKSRIAPKVDPLTALQFELKTGKLPFIIPTRAIEKKYIEEVRRNPLLARFPSIKVVEREYKRLQKVNRRAR